MSIGNQKEFFWKEKFFLLILTTFFLCKFSNQKLSPECVRYELHESSNSSDVIKSLISNCKIKTGYIEKHTVKLLSSWPILYNVTFECCSKFSFISFHLTFDEKCFDRMTFFPNFQVIEAAYKILNALSISTVILRQEDVLFQIVN